MTIWLRGPLQSIIVLFVVFGAVAHSATLDRDYKFGEDSGENGSAGRAVGVNLGGTVAPLLGQIVELGKLVR